MKVGTIAKCLTAPIIVLVFVFLTSCTSLAPGSAAETPCDRQVSQIVSSILAEINEVKRGDLTVTLVELLHPTSCQKINDHSMDQVIALLDHEDDRVRWGAALALSKLGSRAKRAVPALVAALEKWKKENRQLFGSTSRDAICEALEKITEKPWPDPVCDAVRPAG